MSQYHAGERIRQDGEHAPVHKVRRPEYEPPLVCYRGAEMLQELGPAQACSFNHSVVLCP